MEHPNDRSNPTAVPERRSVCLLSFETCAWTPPGIYMISTQSKHRKRWRAARQEARMHDVWRPCKVAWRTVHAFVIVMRQSWEKYILPRISGAGTCLRISKIIRVTIVIRTREFGSGAIQCDDQKTGGWEPQNIGLNWEALHVQTDRMFLLNGVPKSAEANNGSTTQVKKLAHCQPYKARKSSALPLKHSSTRCHSLYKARANTLMHNFVHKPARYVE